MDRRLTAARDAFPQSTDEYAQQVEQLLQHRRAELDAVWEELEEGWTANNERMVRFGLSPRACEEGVVKLNVGGSNVSVCWHLLAETGGFEGSILLALLEGVWGKGRIPRDADGRIVLDESPACIKHIIHTMLKASRTSNRSSSVAVGLLESAASWAVAVDEVPCLTYTACVMGLPGYMPTQPKYVKMNGGSTILGPFGVTPFGAVIRGWVRGSTDEMTLIYRATRDGFGSKAFTARCNASSPKTVSLIRVSSGQGNDDDDSVVGGYTIVPWARTVGSLQFVGNDAFVFMLKDGSATRKDVCKPTKWNPDPDYAGHKFWVPQSDGPYFGAGYLVMKYDGTPGSCTVQTKGHEYFPNVSASPSFLALNGKKVVDTEVYRYSTPTPPTTTAPSTTKPGGDILIDAVTHDIDSLGKVIASSLMEERVVLDRAVKEMEAAGARVSAAAGALETVYGPAVAAGEQDAVVELNVRGTRMTTLRSTLQACPRSALATMFEDRWPATDKDKDEHGGRLIDCNPSCFSKILDVLRMRKRASWSPGTAPEKQEEESGGVLPGGVFIKEADAEAFGKAVNMYFPGCESFIMDLVQPV